MSRGVGRGIVRSVLQTGATDDDAAGRLFERMASEHGLLADIQEPVAMGPIVTIVPAGSVVQ